MKEETIGGILVSWRKKQGMFITDCANELNAPIEYLDAIENNFFSEMPNNHYAYNLIIKYAEFIKIPDKESKKIRNIAKQILKITEQKAASRSFLGTGKSILGNIIFIIMLLVSVTIIYDEDFYGRVLLKNIEIADHETINIDMLNNSVTDTNHESIDLEINKNFHEKNTQMEAKKFNTIEVHAKEDVWVEVADEENIYISRNFKKGERYLFNFRGNEILLTDNLSNIIIKYNETQLVLTQKPGEDVVEIDLSSIIFRPKN